METHVSVFVTGGTITYRYDHSRNSIVPGRNAGELLADIPGLSGQSEVEMIDYSSKPGPHLTPQFGVELMKAVTDKLADDTVAGAVVLQGTDTLEEMAYLSYLVTEAEKPIVFTGALKVRAQMAFENVVAYLAGTPIHVME